jgi:type II secretory pathway component HofQ
MRNQTKAPADKRSRHSRLRDRIETTDQKEKEKSERRRGRSRENRQLADGTGRSVWRLRQREKKEKKIKGIKGDGASDSVTEEVVGAGLGNAELDRLLHFTAPIDGCAHALQS